MFRKMWGKLCKLLVSVCVWRGGVTQDLYGHMAQAEQQDIDMWEIESDCPKLWGKRYNGICAVNGQTETQKFSAKGGGGLHNKSSRIPRPPPLCKCPPASVQWRVLLLMMSHSFAFQQIVRRPETCGHVPWHKASRPSRALPCGPGHGCSAPQSPSGGEERGPSASCRLQGPPLACH